MKGSTAIFWFRKSLRLRDNVALLRTLELAKKNKVDYCCPIFILDPYFSSTATVGPNRWRFLAESLDDLHQSLTQLHSRLIIIQGQPHDVLPTLCEKWNAQILGFEFDSEPYALERDEDIRNRCRKAGAESVCVSGHTLYDLNALQREGNYERGEHPHTYNQFLDLLKAMGHPDEPMDAPSSLPPVPEDDSYLEDLKVLSSPMDILRGKEEPPLPSLYPESPAHPDLQKPSESPSAERNRFAVEHCYFVGGETEAQFRLKQYMADPGQVLSFRKPQTAPNALVPSTTTLSPYLKFGCLSPRDLWHAVQGVADADKGKSKPYSKPPESLHGQLYWREYFYLSSYLIPNFHQMEGNPICKQIDYIYPEENSTSAENLQAWRDGRTGYPWIDACMTQLHQHGWMHHLARHAVSCFLTRGDLYIHWEKGRDVFDELLLDADYALNNANWMWLSASGFFHQYFRVYSPIAFGKKTDKQGDFIRHFLPVLKDFPAKYIYEPWKAPKEVQEKANCIIGKDYPLPIVDHDEVRPANMKKMKAAYANQPSSTSTGKRSASKKEEPDSKKPKRE